MARDDHQLKLRLPDAIREKISSVAEQNGRSMNAEILHRLDQSFSGAFMSKDDLAGIRSQFDKMAETSSKLAEELNKASQREGELHAQIAMMIAALSNSNANSERLLALLETKIDVRQKA